MRNFKINIIFFTFFTLIFRFKATANIDVPKSDIIQFSGRLHMDLLYNNNRDKTDKKNTQKTLRDDLSGFYISSAMFNASCIGTTPNFSPVSLINCTSLALILSLIGNSCFIKNTSKKN